MSKRMIARLYDSFEDAVHVVRDLEEDGFSHHDISILATAPDGVMRAITAEGVPEPAEETGAGAALGGLLGGGVGLLAGLGAIAIPGIGPVVAAGWLVSMLAGAGLGAAAGSVVGALAGSDVEADEAHVYAEGVRRGGAVVSVRCDEGLLPRAEEIMAERLPVDWRQRAKDYHADGWRGLQHDAPPREPRAQG